MLFNIVCMLPETDFSAGNITHAATGVPAFDNETPKAWLTKALNKELAAPVDLKPSLPPALSAMIMTAMAPKASERYETPEAFMHELERARAALAG